MAVTVTFPDDATRKAARAAALAHRDAARRTLALLVQYGDETVHGHAAVSKRLAELEAACEALRA